MMHLHFHEWRKAAHCVYQNHGKHWRISKTKISVMSISMIHQSSVNSVNFSDRIKGFRDRSHAIERDDLIRLD